MQLLHFDYVNRTYPVPNPACPRQDFRAKVESESWALTMAQLELLYV